MKDGNLAKEVALDINKLEGTSWRALEQNIAMLGRMAEVRRDLPREMGPAAAKAFATATEAANRLASGLTLLGSCHEQMRDIADGAGLTRMIGDECPWHTGAEPQHLRVVA